MEIEGGFEKKVFTLYEALEKHNVSDVIAWHNFEEEEERQIREMEKRDIELMKTAMGSNSGNSSSMKSKKLKDFFGVEDKAEPGGDHAGAPMSTLSYAMTYLPKARSALEVASMTEKRDRSDTMGNQMLGEYQSFVLRVCASDDLRRC